MIDFILQYRVTLELPSGQRYVARAYGDRQPGGLWEGWFVFFPLAGGEPLPTDRETTQSKHDDLVYWASGITSTYLEGALQRALDRLAEVRLARRAQWAEREEAYARAEAEAYRAAADEALVAARAAETERRAAEAELREVDRSRPGPRAA
jgi:hypothetical protein